MQKNCFALKTLLRLLEMKAQIFFGCCLLQLVKCIFSTEIKMDYAEPEYLDSLLETGRYEEFSKLLQIDNIDLVRPSKENKSADPHFNKGLENGDILLRPWQQEESRQGLNLRRYPTSKWDSNEVPYTISRTTFNNVQFLRIMEAIKAWNDKIPEIQFRARRRGDKNYVMFFNGKGCYSNLGKVGGQQPISLQGDGCLKRGTIHHEMIHTIGMTHEHERPDRDTYINVLFKNIPKDWHGQYQKTNYADFDLLGPYDYYSIMHYPVPAPETGKPAFEVLKKNVDLKKIGQRDKMTDIDEDKIVSMYA